MAVKKWVGGTSAATTNVATAANYVPSGVPTNGDDLYVEANPGGTDYNMDTNLTTFQAITLASFNVSQTYTGQIGTTGTTNNYLLLAATAINIGYQFGGPNAVSGSNLIRLNNGTVNCTVNVTNTAATSALAAAGPFTFLGTHSSNVLNFASGIMSVGQDPAETSTFILINSGGALTCGSGVTLTTINLNGGTALVQTAATTITVNNGVLTTTGSGAIGTLNVFGGGTILKSTGTITALNVYSASCDMTQDARPKTITTATLYGGASLDVDNGSRLSITFTNPIADKSGSQGYTLNLWPNTSVALS